MKQTKHNEIDLLLRSLSRGGKSGSARRDGSLEDQTVTEHMDADELSSYAERTLPAAARARYTAHLSDCASCRKTVAALTNASGISVSEQAFEQFGQVSFWHQLSAFFSPQVLRFAIPALAIFAVIGVGLFALRDKQQREFVAQNQPSTSTEAPTDSDQVGESSGQETLSDAASSKAKSGEDNDATSRHADRRTASETKEQASKTTDSVSEFATVAKDSPGVKSSAGAGGAVQPTFAPEPAPPPPKPESFTVARNAENVAKEREAPAERDERGRQQDEERARTKNETAQVQAPQSSTRPAGTLGAAAGSRSGEKKRSDASADGSGKDNDDTRTVAGRRFRRQGSAWVDTAYDASHAVTKISRGSEQYRALVADEPGIRSIAEQLSGEVLLVWKGRAYRIR